MSQVMKPAFSRNTAHSFRLRRSNASGAHSIVRGKRVIMLACWTWIPKVSAWRCMPQPIINDSGARNPRHHYIDFAVETENEALLVDIRPRDTGTVGWIARLAEKQGYRYLAVSFSEFVGAPRIQNAKDLIRYAGYDAPLGDRIRILAALEEMGTLTLAECLSVVRESKPMPTIATMILRNILEVDLDEALLGPETVVRRVAK